MTVRMQYTPFEAAGNTNQNLFALISIARQNSGSAST